MTTQSYAGKKEYIYGNISREDLYKNRLSESVFLTITLIAGCTVNLLLLTFFFQGQVSVQFVNNVIVSYMLLCVVLGAYYLPYPLKHYGLVLDKLKDNFKSGTFYGAFGLLFCITVRYIMVKSGNTNFAFRPNIDAFDLMYPCSALIQEVVAKGYLQSHLKGVFEGRKYGKAISIAISSLVFAQFHLFLGLPVLILAFVFSCFLGSIYEKDGSVMTVTITHFLTGAGLFFFN